ncbi:hypothetical protein [Streptomyces angustmyceticus]|uniref:hypothetical protein n=1 Tax=Streptomyces angustmyceticus TaxID=285578 RepID=UPI00344BDFCA
MTPSRPRSEPVVTFTSGAQLLVDEGIVDSITGDGLRYIARTRKNWPFGEGRTYPYGQMGNAKTMPLKPFLAYFRKNPPIGRGPSQKTRRPQ